jgi:hypothetical protein
VCEIGTAEIARAAALHKATATVSLPPEAGRGSSHVIGRLRSGANGGRQRKSAPYAVRTTAARRTVGIRAIRPPRRCSLFGCAKLE